MCPELRISVDASKVWVHVSGSHLYVSGLEEFLDSGLVGFVSLMASF
jgi:hypothetical protein